jgi:AraC-like DNA-binding protein
MPPTAIEHEAVLDVVRRLIDAELPAGTATMRAVAARMRVSERTLRRRLREHNTSYEAVLDSMRRERALAAVVDPSRTVLEISASLGFSEVSAFYRAFKRWTQSTVSSYRRSRSTPPPPMGAPSHEQV